MREFWKFWFFAIFQGVKVQIFVNLTKFWTMTPWKIAKNQNFKNSRILFLYHLHIYMYEQIWLNVTSSFLWVRRFMLKKAIFLLRAIFPIFRNTAFTEVPVTQKVVIIERHMTPFRKEGRYGYNIYQNEQKLNFFVWTPPIPLSRIPL